MSGRLNEETKRYLKAITDNPSEFIVQQDDVPQSYRDMLNVESFRTYDQNTRDALMIIFLNDLERDPGKISHGEPKHDWPDYNDEIFTEYLNDLKATGQDIQTHNPIIAELLKQGIATNFVVLYGFMESTAGIDDGFSDAAFEGINMAAHLYSYIDEETQPSGETLGPLEFVSHFGNFVAEKLAYKTKFGDNPVPSDVLLVRIGQVFSDLKETLPEGGDMLEKVSSQITDVSQLWKRPPTSAGSPSSMTAISDPETDEEGDLAAGAAESKATDEPDLSDLREWKQNPLYKEPDWQQNPAHRDKVSAIFRPPSCPPPSTPEAGPAPDGSPS